MLIQRFALTWTLCLLLGPAVAARAQDAAPEDFVVTVVDEAGKGVADVGVTVYLKQGSQPQNQFKPTYTNAEGVAIFDKSGEVQSIGIAYEQHKGVTMQIPFKPTDQEIQAGKVTIKLPIKKLQQKIELTLVDEGGKPVAGRRISFWRSQRNLRDSQEYFSVMSPEASRSDVEGKVMLCWAGPGSYTLRFEQDKPGSFWMGPQKRLTDEAFQNPKLKWVVPGKPWRLTVNVRCVSPDGEEDTLPPGTFLSIGPTDPNYQDAEPPEYYRRGGVFISGNGARGTGEFVCLPSGQYSLYGSAAVVITGSRVDYKAGEDRTIDLEVMPKDKYRGTLSVTCVGRDGKPVAKVAGELVSIQPDKKTYKATSDAKGLMVFSDLLPETYILSCGDGKVVAKAEKQLMIPSPEDVKLTLDHFRDVTLAVTDDQGKLLTGAVGLAAIAEDRQSVTNKLPDTKLDAKGNARVSLPEGEYILEVRQGDLQGLALVSVPAAKPIAVKLAKSRQVKVDWAAGHDIRIAGDGWDIYLVDPKGGHATCVTFTNVSGGKASGVLWATPGIYDIYVAYRRHVLGGPVTCKAGQMEIKAQGDAELKLRMSYAAKDRVRFAEFAKPILDKLK